MSNFTTNNYDQIAATFRVPGYPYGAAGSVSDKFCVLGKFLISLYQSNLQQPVNSRISNALVSGWGTDACSDLTVFLTETIISSQFYDSTVASIASMILALNVGGQTGDGV